MAIKTRRLRAILRLLTRTERDSEALARGAGLGVFIGFLPLVGMQIATAFLLAPLLGANRIAAALGTFVTNPLTTLPFTALAIWIGQLFSWRDSRPIKLPSVSEMAGTQWLNFSTNIASCFLIGSLLLALGGGVISYFGTHLALKTQRARKPQGP